MESDKYVCTRRRVASLLEELERLKADLKESNYGSFAAAVQVAIASLKILQTVHKKTWGSP